MSPPAKASKTSTPLYAMYVQATRLNPNSKKTQRKQWIVLPPLPPETSARYGISGKNMFLEFRREQQNPENRVKWRHHFDEDGKLTTTLAAEIRDLLFKNRMIAELYQWSISPVLTAQVTARELVDLQMAPKTPYAVLRRFEKVAARKYGLSI